MAMDLRRLRYFLAIAELGGFTKAAADLRIAQPALSRAIRDLEVELSAQLFTRGPHGVELTHAGRRLRAHAEGILASVELAREDISAASRCIEGIVDVGLPPSVGVSLGVKIVERLARSSPQVRVQMVEAYSGDIQNMLLKGRVDVAILNSRTVGQLRIRVEPLLEDEIHTIRARRAGATRASRIGTESLRELARERLILPTRSQGLRLLLEEYAAGLGVCLKPAYEVDSVLIAKEMVLRGLGTAVLPEPVMRREIETGLVKAAGFDPPLRRRLVIALADERPISPAAQVYLEAMRAEVGDSLGK